jgi:hypothetical protein
MDFVFSFCRFSKVVFVAEPLFGYWSTKDRAVDPSQKET